MAGEDDAIGGEDDGAFEGVAEFADVAGPAVAAEKAKFAYGILQTAGAGLGMLSFGPLCLRLGRRRAFILFHLDAFLLVPIVCFVPRD